MLTVTATESAGSSYVSILRPGEQPQTSTLNVERAGQTVPNAAVAALPGTGVLELYTHAGSHLLADVAGYFTGTG
jgi:hypothetical protein